MPALFLPRAHEIRLANDRVYTLYAIDHLRHLEVGAGAQVREGRGAIHAELLVQELDRLARGVLHCLVEVLVEADGDPVVLGLSKWVLHRRLHRQALIAGLEHRQAIRRAQRAFDRRERHLAVALHEVWIARIEERAINLDRDVELRAYAEIVDVEIAAILAINDLSEIGRAHV